VLTVYPAVSAHESIHTLAVLQTNVSEFLQGVSIACYASPVLAIIGMSVRLSVRYILALSENDAS